MLLAFYLLALALPAVARQGVLGAVYVNNLYGSDLTTCGTPSSPCKTLNTALKKAPESAKVYATGTFYVGKTIKLSKNVTIIGNNHASILQRPDGRLGHVFEISSVIKVAFISLKIYRVGLVVIKESASVVIFNCTFDGPTFNKSPSIYVLYLKTVHVKLNITRTLFTNKIQSPLRIRPIRSSKSSANLIVMKCTFNSTGVSSLHLVSNALIQDTIFYQVSGFQLAIYHGQMIRIQGCQFLRGADFGLSIRGFSNYLKNTVLIVDSVFKGQMKASLDLLSLKNVEIKNCLFSKIRVDKVGSPVNIWGCKKIDILNMTCEDNKVMGTDGGCLKIRKVLGQSFVTIRRSTFIRNIVDNGNGGAIYAMCDYTAKCTVDMSETLFLGNLANEGGSMFIYNVNSSINNCNFIKNRAIASGAGLRARGKVRYFLLIEDSKFIGCYSSGQGGALVMVGQMDIKLQNSVFENNLARSGSGGVHVGTQFNLHSTVEIDQASFTNCTAPSIYLYTFKIKLRNITLSVSNETSAPHIQLEGKHVSLKSIDTHMSYPKEIQSNIKERVISAVSNSLTTNGLSVSCSPNFYVEVETFSSERRIEVSCQTCQTNMYTLSHELVLQQIINETVKNLPKCLKCPSGAVCDGHIKVLDNYWGKKVDNRLQVIPCPDGYCCSSQSTPCTSYDTCAGPRTGTLCGTCTNGYVQGYMTDGCVRKGEDEECNRKIFVTYFVISSLAYTLCLTFLPSVLNLLKEMLMQCKRSSSQSCRKEEIEGTDTDVLSIANEVGMNYAAYLTLIMFFFQIASVVQISLPSKGAVDENEPENGSEVKRMIFDIFNFHLSLKAKICPMASLTIIEKLFLNIGLKLSTLLHLVWILLLWRCVALFKSYIQGPYNPTSNTILAMADRNPPRTNDDQLIGIQDESNTVTEIKNLSFPSLVKIGLLKLIKLNFTSAANLLLQLVHCERIGNQFHLYVYGDYICYCWWQIFIFAFILPIFILFPVSFGVSLDLLKARKISTNWFLLSCGLPFLAVWFQLKKRLGYLHKQDFSNDEERCIDEILQLEEELFVSTDKGMRWPVAQLYRNLFIVILNIYILNREYKILWYIALFGAFAMHDRFRKPFKHPYLNTLQLLTSICLFVINLCNVPAAFSSYGDVLSVPQMNICVKVLKYIQYSLYVLVPVSFPLWKMYQQYQSRIKKSENENE